MGKRAVRLGARPAGRSGQTRVRRTAVCAAVSVALVATACNGHRARSSSTTPVGAAAATTSTAAGPGPGDFGTLKAVCGPGGAAGATDKGVSDTDIRVATMADPGNSVLPGLDIEIFQTSQAFVDWCNAAGGILGRKLVLDKRDSALFNVSAQMVASCEQPDFMLVGNVEAFDATGVQQRLSCGLPEIADADLSTAAGLASLSLEAIPSSAAESSLGGALRVLRAFDPASTAHYGLLNGTEPSVRDAGNRDKQAAAQLGYTLVFYEELPPQGVSNWRPYAQAIQANGVQVLGLAATTAALDASLFQAFADIGYFPKWVILNGNNYDASMITEGGTNLDKFPGGVLVTIPAAPLELAAAHPSQYPATTQFVSIIKQYQNVAPKALGVASWSAWLLFAEAVKSCGSNVTRQCVFNYASSQSTWTAGGLTPPIKPSNASGDVPQCFALVKASSTGWTLATNVYMPNRGIYNCDPANVFKLTGFPHSS
jgi:ABC-type branched-subunit amino acid transport system substrate-binding protein